MRRSSRIPKPTQFFEPETERRPKRSRDAAASTPRAKRTSRRSASPSPPPKSERVPTPHPPSETSKTIVVANDVIDVQPDVAVPTSNVDVHTSDVDDSASNDEDFVPSDEEPKPVKRQAPTPVLEDVSLDRLPEFVKTTQELEFVNWVIEHRDTIASDAELAKDIRRTNHSTISLMNAFAKAKTHIFREKVKDMLLRTTYLTTTPEIDQLLKHPKFDMIRFAFVAMSFDKWDINALFRTGLSLLDYAILRDDIPAIHWLRTFPKLIKARSISFACRHASVATWNAVGFSPDDYRQTDIGGNNAWTMMVRMNRVDLIGVSPSFYIDNKDANGITPMALACMFWNYPMVQALRLRGASMYTKLEEDITPMHLAMGCKLLLPLFTANTRLVPPENGSIVHWTCMCDTAPTKWHSDCPGNQRHRDDLFDPYTLVELVKRWPAIARSVDWAHISEFAANDIRHRRARLLLQHFAFFHPEPFLSSGKFMKWFAENHSPQWMDSSLISGAILKQRLDMAQVAMQHVATTRIIDIVQHFSQRIPPEHASKVNELVQSIAIKRSR